MNHIEAMKQALACLKKNHYYMIDAGLPNQSMLNEGFAAITALRTAIEQAEKQEPVAWRYRSVSPFADKEGAYKVRDAWTLIHKPDLRDAHSAICGSPVEPLYTTPPAAPVQEPFHVISRDCAERGCMAHDDRVDGPGVVIGQREFVGLTLEEKHQLNDALNLQGRFTVIEATEAKLREKNA